MEDGKKEEIEERSEFRVHEGIILALYLTPTMYDNMTSIFETILSLLKSLIKSMPKTGLGFYIGNCQNENDLKYGCETPDGVFRVFSLKDIHDKMLKILNTYMKNSTPKDSVINISFTKGERWNNLLKLKNVNTDEYFGTSLYSLLQQAQIDFSSVYRKSEEYTSRKIFVLTDCLKPWNGDRSVLKKLQNKLRDLNSSGTTVYPFILRSNIKQETFEETSFENRLDEFVELFDYPLDDGKKYIPAINEISVSALEEKMLRHSAIRNFAFQCPLVINDIKISVKGLNLLSSSDWKTMNFVHKDGRYHIANRKTIPMANDRPLEKEDIIKVYQIGDQLLPIDDQIQSECMQFGIERRPILYSIGTRAFKAFNPAYTVGKSLFMIPDEEGEFDDSLNKFASLYQSLLKKSMMLLCWGIMRTSSYPRMYYLIPTGLAVDGNLSFKYPQSLAMIEIPFGDEIRNPPTYLRSLGKLEEIDDAELLDELVTATSNLNFENFMNPVLAWNFHIMENHILQVEDIDDGFDSSPKDGQLEMDGMYQNLKIIKKKVTTDPNLKQLVNQLQTRYNRISNAAELKRISESNNSANSKRLKQMDTIPSDNTMALYFQDSKLQSLTNDVLRSYIKSKSGLIKAGKNKSDMIANISDFLRNHGLI